MAVVSIVMPVYNGEKYLRQSIASVVNQTFMDWNLIIVDDCSTDASPEIMNEYAKADDRIQVIHNEVNSKIPASLNNGFEKAAGRYYTWTSDDNIYEQDAIEKMVKYLDEHPDTGLVYSNMRFIDGEGRETGIYESKPEDIFSNNCVGACFMYRADIAKEAGKYSADWFLVEDYEYWLRIRNISKIGHIDELLYKYRHHQRSLSETRMIQVREKLYDLRLNMIQKMNDKIPDRIKTELFKGLFYSSDAPYYDENTLYSEMSDFLNECGNDYAFCSNGKFVKVFFKRTPEPIVLDIFPIDYYNDDISFEQLQNIDMQLKKEFDSNTDKSAVKRDKWYKAIRSSGKIVSKMESSHLCYGLETDFIKMCNSYFSLNYVLPLKKINFENKVFLGHGNPDKMLEMEYGDYMQWPNDAGSTAHGANRRFSRYKNYSNPRYIHTKSEAEDFCKEINEKAGDYQLIVEKYKIFNWKEYFDIVDYLDEHDISYIVYA